MRVLYCKLNTQNKFMNVARKKKKKLTLVTVVFVGKKLNPAFVSFLL